MNRLEGYLFCCDNLYYEFSFLTFFWGGGGVGVGVGNLFQYVFLLLSV